MLPLQVISIFYALGLSATDNIMATCAQDCLIATFIAYQQETPISQDMKKQSLDMQGKTC
jgi:hypothetical protein